MNNVLLVTVTSVEAKAVLDVFPSAKPVPIGPKTYHDLGELGGAHIFMVQSEMGAGGPGASQSTISHAIGALHPSSIIMVGIAFGLRPENQRLGDVLVSTQIRPYDLRKATERRVILRASRPDATPSLLDKFRAGYLSWNKAGVHFGLFLSGQTKINDPSLRDELVDLEPDAIGGEMEGAGVYTAAFERKTDWIIVKAISDWADGKNRDVDQPPAARNAVGFVLHVIHQGGLAMADQAQEEGGRNTEIIGSTTGPVLSGNFQSPVSLGDTYINVTANPAQALHQLPSPPRDFTGREDELAKLRDAIINGGAVIGLRGMGGVGKTALALVLAENLKDCFPDAQLFLDLRGSCPNPMTPAQAMLHIIHGFFPEYQPKGGDTELQGMYCSVLEGKHTLLLMDNARDSRHVEPLVPPKNCALIVTSREHILLPGLMAKDVTCLSMGDAEQLLLKIAPRIGDAVNEIAKLCGCLPLALRLAASAFAERPDLSSQEYTSRLRDAKKRLELVEASLSSSYYLLDPDKQKILRMLAVFPDAFHYSAAAEVWKMELEQARNALAELFRFSLVEFDEHRTRYQLHDMVRLFAESRLSDEERTDSRQRHAEHYVDVLKLTNHLYMLGGNSILQGLSVFDAEWKHIQAAQEWASTNADINPNAADLCVKYTEVSTYCLNLRQNPRERIHWLELAINSAQKIGDRKREGYALGNLGIAYAALGKYRRAIKLHEQALHICREIGNRRGEGTSLGNLGNVYAAMGEPQRAIEFHKQALHIYREIGHRRGEGANLGNLGIAYAALGEPHRAIEFYEQAIQIAREIGDRWGEGIGLGNLGYAYAALGDPRRAIEFFEKALQIFRKIGDRRGEGTCLGNLGNAYGTLGDPRRAIEFYEQALNISREIGHREGESTDLGNLGSAYAALGEFHRAIEFHEQALQIAREIGDRRGECTCLDNMGLTYTALGDTGRAIDFYGQAIQIAREIGDRRGEAIPSWNLGIQARKEGDLQRAITLMQLRVDYEREIGHSNAEKSAAILDDLKVQAKNANMGNRHKRHMRKLKKK